MIPYGRQDITQDDIDSVVEVLRSDYLTQGPLVPQFEEAVANYCGANFAVAVNSATSALHIACLALDLGPRDILWTSPNSFVASANCAIYCGASVDFVDIDPKTYNMSVINLEEKLQKAKKNNSLPKIVVPVHFAGQSCEMKKIHALSKEYGFSIIEDASHAIGGRYLDQPIGCCQYSDITVFSFHPVKIITTAEGGMALTNDSRFANKMNLFRSHGITRDSAQMSNLGIADERGSWYYEQIILGFNYRMTEMQAALGISQLKRLDDYVAKRCELAQMYDVLLRNFDVITPYQHPDAYSAYHLYPIQVCGENKAKTRKSIFVKLRAKEIGVNVHYIPIHLQPFYVDKGFKLGDFKHAENYYAATISLPLFPLLTESQQKNVVSTLKEALQ